MYALHCATYLLFASIQFADCLLDFTSNTNLVKLPGRVSSTIRVCGFNLIRFTQTCRVQTEYQVLISKYENYPGTMLSLIKHVCIVRKN